MRNLFGEGNDVFREGDWARSVDHYTEALGVSEYAESEDISVPSKMRERLHANRAAAYLHIVSALYILAIIWVFSMWVAVEGVVIDSNPILFLSN